jgi:8-amino-7-oxononanoate synthase
VRRRHGPSRRWRLQSGQGVRVRMGGRVFVNFASDDYLDLATDPRLARAAIRATRRYGNGAGASHLLSGYLPPHQALESALATREEFDSAVVFESSLTASVVLVGSLASEEDGIFLDERSSADLDDGCRLSGASIHRYRHLFLDDLETSLRSRGELYRNRLIVTDTLFASSGDLAPFEKIIGLAEQYDASVVLDESNATGVLGDRGRGLTDLCPQRSAGRRRVYKIGSLSKAFGSQGGFVCGPGNLLSSLLAHPRLGSSGSLIVPAAASARRALALADAEPDRRQRVLALAERLRWLLQSRGFATSTSPSQIVTVTVGNARATVGVSRRLEVMGFLVPPICPPIVPRGTSRLRISLTAGHTDAEVDRLAESLGAVRSALSV